MHIFYHFTGIHSLLIGFFLFYVPVYLWKLGVTLSGISYFISMIGLGFCCTLWCWERLTKRVSLKHVITASFGMEVLVLSMVYLSGSIFFLPCFALMLGAYNCFFWITQRLLFLEMIVPDNSGRHFGNFQIYVVVILKTGVFAGGILLEKHGFPSIYLISILFAICGVISFRFLPMQRPLPEPPCDTEPLSILELWRFQDRFNAKIIFALDGFFLYLESYFWVVSLFLIVKESFWHLGLLVIFLTVVFSILFIFIKNTIDRSAKQKVYFLAVVLYMAGWFMRGTLGEEIGGTLLAVLLIIITFCTSFFRLAFNKRFFDHAKQTDAYRYVLMKSYWSQFFLAVIFAVLGWHYSVSLSILRPLEYTYFAAGGLAMLYLLYLPSRPNTE